MAEAGFDYLTSDNPLLWGVRVPVPRDAETVEWPHIEQVQPDCWNVYMRPRRDGGPAWDFGAVWVSRWGGFEAVHGGRVEQFATREAAIGWLVGLHHATVDA